MVRLVNLTGRGWFTPALIFLSLVICGFLLAIMDATLWQGDNFVWRSQVTASPDNKFIWNADTWHLAKRLIWWVIGFCFWLLDQRWTRWIWLFGTPIIVGRIFVLFYHTLLLHTPDQSFWDWITGTFLIKGI